MNRNGLEWNGKQSNRRRILFLQNIKKSTKWQNWKGIYYYTTDKHTHRENGVRQDDNGSESWTAERKQFTSRSNDKTADDEPTLWKTSIWWRKEEEEIKNGLTLSMVRCPSNSNNCRLCSLFFINSSLLLLSFRINCWLFEKRNLFSWCRSRCHPNSMFNPW